MRDEHFPSGASGRLTMGLALRGPELSARESRARMREGVERRYTGAA